MRTWAIFRAAFSISTSDGKPNVSIAQASIARISATDTTGGLVELANILNIPDYFLHWVES
jgi:hypothetical protein